LHSDDKAAASAEVQTDVYNGSCGATVGEYGQATYGELGGGYGGIAACGARPCPWFAGGAGLVLTREDDDHYFFSYDDANEAFQWTDFSETTFDVAGGFEVHFGRYFCYDCATNGWRHGIEARYWGLFPESEGVTTTRRDVFGNLNGIHNWDDLYYNGDTADRWVNNATVHSLERESEVHNVEVNWLRFCSTCADPCRPTRFQCHWLAGFRYFKLRDSLRFSADTVDWHYTYSPEEIHYNIDTDNNLFGFHLGGSGRYCLTKRLSLDLAAKAGLFGNWIDHDSVIGGAAGVAVIDNGPNAGRAFEVHNSKSDVAFLGELNAGLKWCILHSLTATVGYRVVGVSGVALPTDQIYHDLRGINDVELIASNGSLILHGGYAGLEFNY
jgi:hypothetical protein